MTLLLLLSAALVYQSPGQQILVHSGELRGTALFRCAAIRFPTGNSLRWIVINTGLITFFGHVPQYAHRHGKLPGHQTTNLWHSYGVNLGANRSPRRSFVVWAKASIPP